MPLLYCWKVKSGTPMPPGPARHAPTPHAQEGKPEGGRSCLAWLLARVARAVITGSRRVNNLTLACIYVLRFFSRVYIRTSVYIHEGRAHRCYGPGTIVPPAVLLGNVSGIYMVMKIYLECCMEIQRKKEGKGWNFPWWTGGQSRRLPATARPLAALLAGRRTSLPVLCAAQLAWPVWNPARPVPLLRNLLGCFPSHEKPVCLLEFEPDSF
jgi:hypothetical protein